MEDHRLATLFDYTKFHIGLYATLISGLFGVIAFAHDHENNRVLAHLLTYAKWVAALILVAGAAGGAIASNIVGATNYDIFKDTHPDFFGYPCSFLTYGFLVHAEHIAFWLAVLLGAYAFFTIKSTDAVRQHSQHRRS
jgi:hypothetical protein